MEFINWDLVWNNEMAITSKHRLDNGNFWDDIARRGKKVNIPDNITQIHLELISASKDDIILEIGPGQGRLTLPLARSASRIIGVEPSNLMIQNLKNECKKEGMENIDLLNLSWNELKPPMLDEFPDIVISSYSLFMTDISKQLKKINEIAKKKVVLILPGEQRIPSEVQQILFGTSASSGMSEHVILFNILHQMGIDANVNFTDYSSRKTYSCMEEAVKELSFFYNVPVDRLNVFQGYLEKELKKEENGAYSLQGKKKTASIWWWKD